MLSGVAAPAAALLRIQSLLEQLSPAERRVGKAVLDDPGRVIIRGVSELAADYGVAQPTLSRFAKSVGFTGFPGLRLAIARDLASADAAARLATSSPPAFSQQLGQREGFLGIAAKLSSAGAIDIWTSAELLNPAEQLADSLQALGIPASASAAVGGWSRRARGLPAEAVVVVLSARLDDTVWAVAPNVLTDAGIAMVALAHEVPRQAVRSHREVLIIPDADRPVLSALLTVDLLAAEVERQLGMQTADSVSPRQRWQHVVERYIESPAGTVPVTLLTHAQTEDRPLAVFYSGHTAHRHHGLPPGVADDQVGPRLVAAILSLGWNVALPDSPHHGDRKRVWEDDVTLTRQAIAEGHNLMDIERETVALVDAFLSDGLVATPDQIVVVGQSWGGYQAMAHYLADERLRWCAAVMPIVNPAQLEEYAQVARAGDALMNSSRWAGKSGQVIMLSGVDDRIATDRAVRDLHHHIEHVQSVAHAAQFVSLPGVGHHFDPAQVEHLVNWLTSLAMSGENRP